MKPNLRTVCATYTDYMSLQPWFWKDYAGTSYCPAISLSDIYPRTHLLQVNSSAILSHMYGSTPKEVANLFTTIREHALNTEDKPALIVVLIDEIDKLVPCRKKISSKNEPEDTARVSVLHVRPTRPTDCSYVGNGRSSDRSRPDPKIAERRPLLHHQSDPAFLDRCRLKEQIDAPAVDCIFEILRGDINTKIQQGDIVVKSLTYDVPCDSIMTDDAEVHPSSDITSASVGIPAAVPTLSWAATNWPPTAVTAVSLLRQIASLADGLSARNLRGLLDVIIFETFAEDAVPELRDTLDALEVVIRREAMQAPEARQVIASAMRGVSPCAATDEQDFDVFEELPIETNQYSDDE